jgi:2-polyprenyl-6-methoxyphenol hydroxylase-like FAD-dependent oxidoreductase
MAGIGIVGSGIAGLQLALRLQQRGVTATLYSDRTPADLLASQLPSMVARNGCTRARERQLGVNHWDAGSHDMERLAVRVLGPRPIAFSGSMRDEAAQAVDMRIYCSRLLEDFSNRGGRVVIRAVQTEELDAIASQHDLLVVASGRASLARVFPRVAEHSPFTRPQRLAVAGLFRGIAYSDPGAIEVTVTPGSGEILTVPIQSFEPDLTGIVVMVVEEGGFDRLRHLRYQDDPRGFVAVMRALLAEHAPSVNERVDPASFDLARPQDLAYAAITPTVRRGFIELASGRPAIALGDAHVVIDPLTGQGANNASHSARVLADAICRADAFDPAFCRKVEQEMCDYVVPVSDASNARVQPPSPQFREILAAAARDQAIADVYAHGFSHPDRFWAIASSPERTAAFLSAQRTPQLL